MTSIVFWHPEPSGLKSENDCNSAKLHVLFLAPPDTFTTTATDINTIISVELYITVKTCTNDKKAEKWGWLLSKIKFQLGESVASNA